LKQNEYVKAEKEILVQLKALGVTPGNLLYIAEVNMTKQKEFER